MNKRIWLKAIVIGVISAPLVLLLHIPIWIPIIGGTVYVVFSELKYID